MDPTITAAIIGAVAAILAAVIGTLAGRSAGRSELRKSIDDAPRKYVDHLDRLIKRALAEGKEKALLNGRAIVSVRNDLRSSLMQIHHILNSEIDRLAEDIGMPVNGERRMGRRNVAEPASIFDTIEVLARKWPSKKDQVEVELRKVLAELGLLGQSPEQPKTKPPKPKPPQAQPPSPAGV